MTLPVAILAGGLATRLRPITEKIPKSLVEVAGQPFILHQFDLLRGQGLTRVVVCAGYLGELLRARLGDGGAWGMALTYSFDGPELLGTGGALKLALPWLGDEFFVLYGDSYLDIDYLAVAAAFARSGELGLMTVHRNEGRWDRSNVIFKDGQIVRYDKKQHSPEMLHIDHGLSVLKASALAQLVAGERHELTGVYQRLVQNKQLAGYEVAERFYEIGSPAGLRETQNYILSKKGAASKADHSLPA